MLLFESQCNYVAFVALLERVIHCRGESVPAEIKTNQLIGYFEGSPPTEDKIDSECEVYKSYEDDIIFLCWIISQDQCVVESMSTALFDKYDSHGLVWAKGTRRPNSSDIIDLTTTRNQNTAQGDDAAARQAEHTLALLKGACVRNVYYIFTSNVLNCFINQL